MRIVSESRRPVRALPPPSPSGAHEWQKAAPARTALFVERAVAEGIEKQVTDASRGGRETMGLLLGDRFRSPADGLYAIAASSVTAPVEASRTHVRWDAGTFDELAANLEASAFESVIVGWYHSHLGDGCFLSATDLDTQRRYFAQPHQVAWVLDPLQRASAAFQLEGKGAGEVGVAVFGGRRLLSAYFTAKSARKSS